MKKIFFATLAIIAFVLLGENLFSQGVAINTDGTTANPSAMLDVKSTNAGILVPRLTLAQRGTISNPATGLLIFQTDNTPGFYYNTGTPAVPSWIKLSIPTDNFDDADADATNELQTISILGHDITLSDGGGTITVPDNNTTYSAGNQLSLTGTTFNVTEGTGSGLDADLLDGQHYSDIQSWVNTNDDNTTYSAGTGLTLTGTVFTPTFGTTAGTVSEGNHAHTNMVTGTGTTDYLARWTSTSTLGIGAVRDNGARVGIGTAPHATYLAQFAGDLLLTTGWLRTTGSAGWYSETHGGGWYMTDATWIRSYGSKSIYHDSGILRSDGTFQVGASGATFNVANGGNLSYRTNVLFANTTGNVGIGTASPVQKLHVVGQIAIDDNSTRIFQGNGDALRVQTASGYTDFGPQNASWSHFSTDRPRFYFNTGLTVDSGNVGSYDEDLSLQTAGTTRVSILNSNGYVGINNASPSEMLNVSGNVLASGIVYWGNAGSRTETRDNAGLQGDAGAKSGFYETSAPAPAANWPVGASSWWHLLDIRHSNSGNNYAMQFAGSFFDQNLYFRKTNASATTAWSRVMTSNDISGTTNYVSKFTSTNTIGNSQIFDNGTNVGIGTSGPSEKLEVSGGTVRISTLAGTGNRPVTTNALGNLQYVENSTFALSANFSYSPDDLRSSWAHGGTAGGTLTGDDSYVNVTLPFSLVLEGISYNTITICTNGWVSFGTIASTALGNTSLPTSTFSNPVILAYWDDLTSTDIRYGYVGTAPNLVYIIDYTGITYTGSYSVNFQVQIHQSSGLINVKYRDAMNAFANGQSATIGFQSSGGASAKAYPITYNGKVLDDNRDDSEGWSVCPVR